MLVLRVYLIRIVVNSGIMFTESVTTKLAAMLILLVVPLVHRMLLICGKTTSSICTVMVLTLSIVLCLKIN